MLHNITRCLIIESMRYCSNLCSKSSKVTSCIIFKQCKIRLFSQKSMIDKLTRLPHLNVGTIGHVDHGKTTLTAAITKVLSERGKAKFINYDEIDRAEEEKARGITINICHVNYSSDKRHYAHTDCPGHIDYIKNMITGTAQMDCAILIVAASEGIMPQTTQHLLLAKQIGVKNVIVYMNKVDLIDSETAELVELEVRELLDKVGFDDNSISVIFGSALCALQGKNLEIGRSSIFKLIDALDSVPLPERNLNGKFCLPVEKSVTVHGRGTVAIGTISQGIVMKNDKLNLIGRGIDVKTVASDLHVFHQSVQKANAGENVGILLRGIKSDLITRGMVLCEPGSLSQTDSFQAQVYVQLKDEGGRTKPLMNNYISQIYIENWDIACLVKISDDIKMIMPGDTNICTIILRLPMFLKAGQKFFIRETSKTVVTGIISRVLEQSTEKYSGFNYVKRKPMRIEGNDSVTNRRRREKQSSRNKK